MLLLTANVAALAFGEGVADLAVMKALGFKNGTVVVVVLAEALALWFMGAVSGVAFASLRIVAGRCYRACIGG